MKTKTPRNSEEIWARLGSSFAKALQPCESGEAVIMAAYLKWGCR